MEVCPVRGGVVASVRLIEEITINGKAYTPDNNNLMGDYPGRL
jgi:hypothetical protein